LEGEPKQRRRSGVGAVAAGVVATALVLGLVACGGDDDSPSAQEPTGTYPVEVVTAEFPTRQRLGETTLLRLGVRNEGERTMPALTMTISVGGEEGRTSSLPFGYRDPQSGIAQPDRPIWVLSARYPKADGSSDPAGAETSNPKTFDFGPLKPGKTVEAIWKLNAVKTGNYTLFYEVGAGLSGEAKAETASGADAGGSFATRITEVPPETVVTDSGEVVPAPKDPTEANR
jgi:hypothetical protein